MSLFSSIFHRILPFTFQGWTDYHSHILPGVDDGVRTLDESLRILDTYEQMGISEVWLTPHIMEDMPNTTEQLRQRFAILLQAYNGPVRLKLAAENMIDPIFMQRLSAGDLLPIGDNREMLLVEISYFNPPINLHHTFELIMARGYYPLLAHPERYHYLESMKDYERLKAMGVRFQLNIFSLQGYYGRQAKAKAHNLLRKGMYDRYGSDLHRGMQLKNFKLLL